MDPNVAPIITNAPVWATYALATVSNPRRLLYVENAVQVENHLRGPIMHRPNKIGELNHVMWENRPALFIRCKE